MVDCRGNGFDDHDFSSSGDDNDGPTLFCGMVSSHEGHGDSAWYVGVRVMNHQVKCKIDTGAQANIMTKQQFNMLNGLNLTPTNVKLSTYSGEHLKVAGQCVLPCEHNGEIHPVNFIIVDSVDSDTILGLKSSCDMHLVQRCDDVKVESLIDSYKDVFQGLGCLDGEYHMTIDESVPPVIHPPRRVPIALRDKLREELDRMERDNIICRVEEPTRWVNPMCIVTKKSGQLRLCLDPKDLNRAIQREHYPLPKVEEIMSRLNGAMYFSILDANQAFYQVRLDAESSKLCTMNTPFGRYRFLRLPYGVKSASEVFHRTVVQAFEKLEGVETFVDDVLVWGSTREEHDRRLEDVLKKARSINLRLNKSKCQFAVREVKYLSHIIGHNQVKPDDEKVRAINEMPRPHDKKAVQRFLGMVTYVAKFLPSLSEISAPLRQLVKDDVEWHWDAEQEGAFEHLKRLITGDTVLQLFNPKKSVVISVDSSQSGMGAVLMQDDKPVEYASRALTSTQQRYAQIEKELLAVTFGLERFHQFAYGRDDVVVETDHKPLESIIKKPLSQAPARIQRLLLRTQRYPGAKVLYRPGRELKVADALSRAYLADTFDDGNLDAQVHLVISHMPMSESWHEQLKKETQNDVALQKLRQLILLGWPDTKAAVPPELHEYWNFRDELSCIDNVILKGERLVIPKSMRSQMMSKIHAGHMGMEKCKRRAREVLYWPGMNGNIEEAVARCAVCLEQQKSQVREPMLPHETPQRPWEIVATDLFWLNARHHIVVVDYYSRFFEVAPLASSQSSEVISNMKAIFARHGIPRVVKSDNGPCYASRDFKKFADDWEFRHVTSSPTFSQSNGLAERTVQTVKALFKKAKASGNDPYMSLLEYRNTPLDNIGSPAQMLMSRRLRLTLPSTAARLTPKVLTNSDTQEKLKRKQDQQRRYYDRTARPKSPLSEGEVVRVQLAEKGPWTPGIVQAKHATPRSYIIATDKGTYRRNRRHVRQSREKPTDHSVPQHEFIHDSDMRNPRDPVPCLESLAMPQSNNSSPLLSCTPTSCPSTPTSGVGNPVCSNTDTSNSNTSITTRSGRVVRAPHRLDL